MSDGDGPVQDSVRRRSLAGGRLGGPACLGRDAITERGRGVFVNRNGYSVSTEIEGCPKLALMQEVLRAGEVQREGALEYGVGRR